MRLSQSARYSLLGGIAVLVVSSFFVFRKQFNQSAPVKTYSMHMQGEDPISAVNSPERYGALVFVPEKPSSTVIASAVMCVENSTDVEKVDLFMPGMGHGSQPPTVTPVATPPDFMEKPPASAQDVSCMSVSNMQLFMTGLWQVRVFYKEGKVGLFDVELVE